MRYAIIALIPLLALLAACNGGGEPQPTPTPTPSPAVRPSPTAEPTPEPAVAEPKLIFVRGNVLFMANVDGSRVTQLTASGEEVSFVGLSKEEGASPAVYYTAKTGDDTYALRTRDLATDRVTELLADVTVGRTDLLPIGSLSPDGRYVAFTHSEGIDLSDLTTGSKRRLINNGRGCPPDYSPSDCLSFYQPRWSPDGRLLMAALIAYEGGHDVLISLEEETQTPSPASDGLGGRWSPSGQSICAKESAISGGGLYLSSTPDWQSRQVLSEHRIADCAWLDERTLAILTITLPPSIEGALMTVDAVTDEPSSIATLRDATYCCEGSLSLVPNKRAAITQFSDGGDPRSWTQPTLVDLDTGASQTILDPGDSVVALLEP